MHADAANANPGSAKGKVDPAVLITKADYLAVMGGQALGGLIQTSIPPSPTRLQRKVARVLRPLILSSATRVRSKYQPLIDYLAEVTGDEVVVTYKEVAALIGGPLPEYAVLQTHWWRGKEYDHVQAWRALGWRAHGSATHLRVRFTRDAEEGTG